MNDDMKLLSLKPEWAVFRDMWIGFISGQQLSMEGIDVYKINDDGE